MPVACSGKSVAPTAADMPRIFAEANEKFEDKYYVEAREKFETVMQIKT